MNKTIKQIAYKIRELTPPGIKKRIGLIGDFFSYPKYPSLKPTLEYLKNWGFNPSVAVDIGASGGEWTRAFKGIFPSAKVLMVEAQEKMALRLQEVCKDYSGEVFYEVALLGATDDAQVVFAEAGFGSSIFEENSTYARHHVQKSLTRLDSLLSRHLDFQKIDFLKLDVQGYELEVLKGAAEVAQSAEFVLMEASLIPINKGCPLFSGVLEFMEKINFRLLDFCSQYRRKDGALWQTDLLFIKNDSKFIPAATLNSENWA